MKTSPPRNKDLVHNSDSARDAKNSTKSKNVLEGNSNRKKATKSTKQTLQLDFINRDPKHINKHLLVSIRKNNLTVDNSADCIVNLNWFITGWTQRYNSWTFRLTLNKLVKIIMVRIHTLMTADCSPWSQFKLAFGKQLTNVSFAQKMFFTTFA